MDGLECREIRLSELLSYVTFRIDSHFYEKKYLSLKKTIFQWDCLSLEQIVSKIVQTGHTPPMSNMTYYGGSIALIKTDNLRNNCINLNFSHYLSDKGNTLISSTTLAERDIITTIIGATEDVIARSAMVWREHLPANINQNIVQIRINPQKALPEYVYIYLSSTYGKQYLAYFSRQTEQVNLNCDEVNSVVIPMLSWNLQCLMKSLVNQAHELMLNADKLYANAQEFLLSELRFDSSVVSSVGITQKRFSESFGVSGRLDAEYYQPKYEKYFDMIQRYRGGYSSIDNEFTQVKTKCSRTADTYYYVEIGDIDVGTGSATSTLLNVDDLPDNAKIMTHINDVIVSTVRPNRGAVAILQEDNLLVSGAFTVLREKGAYKKEVLHVLLRSPLYRDWLLRYNVGTAYPVIKDRDVLQMPVPLLDEKTQNQIAEMVQNSFSLRRKSEQLIKMAVRAVEIAIEQDESAAVAYLRDNAPAL